jgi:hypothetical protein
MLANTHEPQLTTYDRFGNRIDEVAFHPSWHWLMTRAVGHGLQAAPWEQSDAGSDHAHVRRAAGFLAWSQTEPGHGCPISMTYAAVPALRVDETLAKEWTPALAATTYDPGIRPVAEKAGALAGMGMTEKQGGSGRPGQRDRGQAHPGRGRVHAARPQVVHLRADERRLPRAGAGTGGAVVLRGPPRAARRQPQPSRRGPAQGQARATGPTRRRRSSSTARWRDGSGTRAEGSARSSRWWPRPGSTACSGRPP